jgi:hypothetical protein
MNLPLWAHLPKLVILPAMHICSLYLLWTSGWGIVPRLFLTPVSLFVVGLVYNLLIALPLGTYLMKKCDLDL